MRRIHIPLFLMLALYLLGHFGSGLREPFSNLSSVTQAQSYLAGIHYAPAENLERLDADALRRARRKIDICMYAFTDRYLAEILVDRARNGVRVRIYRDGEQFEQEQRWKGGLGSTTNLMRGQRNIEIRVKPPSQRLLLHLKSFAVDGTLLRDGSANWSPAGLKDQDNSLSFAADPGALNGFERNFDAIWNRRENRVVQ